MDAVINTPHRANKLFKDKGGKIVPIKEVGFDQEINIQKIIQDNLEIIFNLQLVAEEVSVDKNRIDTLGFDKESSSFVIIEYKNKEEKGLLEQGLAYRNSMLENLAKVTLEYQHKVDKNDVDQSRVRLILVAPSFNERQIQASESEGDIELWEIHRYDDEIIQFLPIFSKSKSHTKFPKTSRSGNIGRSQEITARTEEDYLEHNASGKTKKLYCALRKRIVSLDHNINIELKKSHIAFKTGRGIIRVYPRRRKIHVKLDIKKNEVRHQEQFPNIREAGRNDPRAVIAITDKTEIPHVIALIEQARSKSLRQKQSVR